jgi:translation initiation factor IF-2
MPKTQSQNSIVRPPVVAVMGHIDHGKSTLLDYIRKSNITEGEVGGITQSISAYEVTHKNAEGAASKITFLDTPGHAAFVSLRDRGARIADIAILVVSAEDGVKTQTIEALRSIKEAGLPYIVAINKIDKESANVERTKISLSENEIYIEGYGGDVPALPISAKTGKGVPELLDMILLMSELGELTANPDVDGEGVVLETGRSKTGISATLIIKNGVVKNGMYIAVDGSIAPVRIMENFLGEKITEATFSSPIRVIGFDSAPSTGATFKAFGSKKEAEEYRDALKELNLGPKAPSQIAEGALGPKFIIPVLIKADQAGAIEAIDHELGKIENDRVAFKVVAKSVGDITENDVKAASGKLHTIILGFNVKADAAAKNIAERLGLEIKIFDIIYKLTEYIEQVAIDQTPKIEVEERTGIAKILKLFSKVKDKQILGGRVEEGTVSLGEEVKVTRRDAEIGRGFIKELQKQKTKVSEVEAGSEFGAMIESKIEMAPGDKIECFKKVIK